MLYTHSLIGYLTDTFSPISLSLDSVKFVLCQTISRNALIVSISITRFDFQEIEGLWLLWLEILAQIKLQGNWF